MTTYFIVSNSATPSSTWDPKHYKELSEALEEFLRRYNEKDQKEVVLRFSS